MLRMIVAAIAIALAVSAHAANVIPLPDRYRITAAPMNPADTLERPAAIDGSAYAVIAPTYDNPAASQSYIRLFNGGSAAATFNLTVIGSPSAKTYGTTAIAIPPYASPQFRIDTLLTMAGAAALSGDDSGYVVYLQSTEPKAGYQHVTFNGATALFGNASDCNSTINEVLGVSGSRALTNIHTSRLSAYPSTIYIHNYASAPTTYHVAVIDAGTADATTGAVRTGSGAVMGTRDIQIGANTTYAVPFSFFENAIGWTPSASQLHANLVVTNAASTSTSVTLAQSIVNQSLGGEIDMSVACAINAVSAPAAVTTAFAGTLVGANGESGTISVTVQTAIAATSSAPVSAEAIEKPQATVQATGTLKIGGVNYAVSGTFDTVSGALSLSGSSYALTGTESNGGLSGSYSGPNNSSGWFSALNATQNPVTRYCGTYFTPIDSGTWNMQVSANGNVSGTASGGGTLSGHLTGSVLSGSSDGEPFAGTVSFGSVYGTYTAVVGHTDPDKNTGKVNPIYGTGTFSGSACS
jgi:hypothetical protein